MITKIKKFFTAFEKAYPGNRDVDILEKELEQFLKNNLDKKHYQYQIESSGFHTVKITIAWYEDDTVHLLNYLMKIHCAFY